MYTRRPQPGFPRRARERGVVLLLALIFLVLLTLLAIGASSGSLLQQRMVSATRSAQLATMSADTALRGAEWQLWSFATKNQPLDCNRGSINSITGCVIYNAVSPLYGSGGSVTRFRTGDNTWLPELGQITYKGASGAGYMDQGADYFTANLARNPQYIIENLGLPSSGGPSESGDTGAMSGKKGQPVDCTYRITARATGGSQNTVRVVESTFDSTCPTST